MTRRDLSGTPEDTGKGASKSSAAERGAMRSNAEVDINAIVRDAVRRETLENLRCGKRIVRGHWVTAEGYQKSRLRNLLRDVLLMIEAIVFWGIIAGVALGCFLVLVRIL